MNFSPGRMKVRMTDKVYNIEERLDFFFEASGPNLLNYNTSFWKELLVPAKIKIVSETKTENIAAFILSESSLFVLPHRIQIITCGDADVLALTRSILKYFNDAKLNFVTYQRRGLVPSPDHYFERTQLQIYELLKSKLDSIANLKGLSLFYQKDKTHFENLSTSIQVLMFDPDRNCLNSFLKARSTERIARIFAKETSGYLKDFQVDSHDFEPIGYSINAIKDLDFYCYHFSPDEPHPYISFELNTLKNVQLNVIIHYILEFFICKQFEIQIHQFGEQPASANMINNIEFKSQNLQISNLAKLKISFARNAE